MWSLRSKRLNIACGNEKPSSTLSGDLKAHQRKEWAALRLLRKTFVRNIGRGVAQVSDIPLLPLILSMECAASILHVNGSLLVRTIDCQTSGFTGLRSGRDDPGKGMASSGRQATDSNHHCSSRRVNGSCRSLPHLTTKRKNHRQRSVLQRC